MNNQEATKDRTIIKTVLATLTLLVFFFLQGAVVAVNGIEGAASALIRGGIIGSAAVAAIVFSLIKHKNLTAIGFRKPEPGASRKLLYYIPLLIIALSALAAGIDSQKGAGFALANLFLALCVGFAEEIYFRGVICSIWLEKGAVKAMVISSILFGLCHLMNVLGGAGLTETILQIFFALAYGVAFALIFIVSGSIWPCILLHAFHDGCSFLSADGSARTNILVGVFQFAVMITYIAAVVKRNKTVLSRPAAPEEQNAVR